MDEVVMPDAVTTDAATTDAATTDAATTDAAKTDESDVVGGESAVDDAVEETVNEAVDGSPYVQSRSMDELVREAVMLLPNIVKLMNRLLRDERVPMRKKVLVGVALAYAVSPVDLIPDFVAGLGKLDDLVLFSIVIDSIISSTDIDIVREYWDGSEEGLDLIRTVFAWISEIVPSSLRSFFN